MKNKSDVVKLMLDLSAREYEKKKKNAENHLEAHQPRPKGGIRSYYAGGNTSTFVRLEYTM